MITEFTPYRALIGGALIGLSVVLFMRLNGRIAGISGMIHGLIPPDKKQFAWRVCFLLGMLIGGIVYFVLPQIQFTLRTDYPLPLLIGGGLLVGFGTRMGQGCTSGHGICGMARLSKRSIAATLTFMITGFITVYVTRHLFGAV